MKTTARQIPGLIRKIVLVDEISREDTSAFHSRSLPGHLIHVVVSGAVTQHAEGRQEDFREGDAVWYFENEPVQGRVLRAPWRFISINFDAPELAPPSDQCRVVRAGPGTLERARGLLDLWFDESSPPLRRHLRAMAILLEIIMDLHPGDSPDATTPVYPANAREIWWRAEKKLRFLLEEPLPLERIAEVAGVSERTVARACRAATGMSPARRLRELRMAQATGLLQHTDLPITEIAFRAGYSRVQEFSRDFRKRSGLTPSGMRRSLPTYKNPEH